MTDLAVVIRASSLSQFPDCMRRTAARVFADQVADAGFKLRELPPGIGAATGTATHTGAAFTLNTKMNQGWNGSATEAEQRSLDQLAETIAPGCTWDDTSPNLNTAQKQVVRQVRSYRTHLAPHIQPVMVEQRMETGFRGLPGVTVSGQPDCLEATTLHDTKTGVMRRANGFQYGTYSLLARTNGYPITRIVEDYVPRVRITKEQPPPEVHEYDPYESEKAAAAIITRMVGDLRAFEETGEPWAFLANPQSMLCSDKFCPAWGTDFCRAHKGAFK